MPQLRSMARITMPGFRDETTIQGQAHLLWQSVHGVCVRSKAKRVSSGYCYEGSLQKHVLSLWPEQSTASSEKLGEFTRPIYAYLRATNNAVCETPGSRRPVWWISDTWSGGIAPERTEDSRDAAQRRSEERVTPHEAGEDREPAPVVRRRKAVTTEATVPEAVLTAFAASRDRRSEDHEAQNQLIEEFIATNSQPVIAAEIAHIFGIHKSTARNSLNELLEQGKIHARTETKEERLLRAGGPIKATHAVLYSTQKPVPARTQRVAVEGFLQVPSEVHSQMSTQEIKDRLAHGLRWYIRRGKFTPAEISERQGVAVASARRHLDQWCKDGLIVRTKQQRNSVYRIPKEREDDVRALSDEAKTRVRHIRGQGLVVLNKPTRRPPVQPFVAASQAPTPGSVVSSQTVMLPEGPEVDKIKQILEIIAPAPDATLAADNHRLQMENADLRDQLRRARAALRELAEDA